MDTCNQFNNIKEVDKHDSATIYSTIWMDGPLNLYGKQDERTPNKNVSLRCINNSQNIISEFFKWGKIFDSCNLI